MERNIKENRRNCSCTYEPFTRKGKCCECIAYHWSMGELPGCLFPPKIEKTYDRSIKNLLSFTKIIVKYRNTIIKLFIILACSFRLDLSYNKKYDKSLN